MLALVLNTVWHNCLYLDPQFFFFNAIGWCCTGDPGNSDGVATEMWFSKMKVVSITQIFAIIFAQNHWWCQPKCPEVLSSHPTLLRRYHVVSGYQAGRATLHIKDNTDYERDHRVSST